MPTSVVPRLRFSHEPLGDAEVVPHTRRIPIVLMLVLFITGTTSACAENTLVGFAPAPRGWNYLRVRGEYRPFETAPTSTRELPPHTWRIRGVDFHHHIKNGTTSACAENTGPARFSLICRRNYLRVRGEYTPGANRCPPRRELPPRARRIHSPDELGGRFIGTTSACAENTDTGDTSARSNRNYLRVRGEYVLMRLILMLSRELPPRARRIRSTRKASRRPAGTTSACAENTPKIFCIRSRFWNYLRVRGEYWAPNGTWLG